MVLALWQKVRSRLVGSWRLQRKGERGKDWGNRRRFFMKSPEPEISNFNLFSLRSKLFLFFQFDNNENKNIRLCGFKVWGFCWIEILTRKDKKFFLKKLWFCFRIQLASCLNRVNNTIPLEEQWVGWAVFFKLKLFSYHCHVTCMHFVKHLSRSDQNNKLISSNEAQ